MLNIFGHKGNAMKTTLRFYLIAVKMAMINYTNKNKCWYDAGEGGRNLYLPIVEM
jgi:hypothetical protein